MIGKGYGVGILVSGNTLFLTFSIFKKTIQIKVHKANIWQFSFCNSYTGLNNGKDSQNSIEPIHGRQKVQ